MSPGDLGVTVDTDGYSEGGASGHPPFLPVSPPARRKAPEILKTRALFRAASAGPRTTTDSFTMQRRLPGPNEVQAGIRFGITVTKKLGNAPLRNRVRRRMRAALAEAAVQLPQAPNDFVLVAREAAVSIAFPALVGDIIRAAAILATRDRPNPPRRPKSAGKHR